MPAATYDEWYQSMPEGYHERVKTYREAYSRMVDCALGQVGVEGLFGKGGGTSTFWSIICPILDAIYREGT